MPQPSSRGMEPAFGDSFRSCYLYSSLEQTMSSPESRLNSDLLYGQERPPGCRPGSGDELMSLAALCRRRRPAAGLVELLSDLVDDEPPCHPTSRSRERWDVSALEDFTRYSKAEPAGDPGKAAGGRRGLEDEEEAGSGPEETVSLLDVETGELSRELPAQTAGQPSPPHAPPSPAPFGRRGLELGAGLQSEEHNYSLFGPAPPPPDTDDQSERSEAESGSDTECEATQSDEEDREDFSDYLSETGNELSAAEAGVRQCKRRFFWEYSDSHATPSKQRLLLPSEWDCSTLPSNVYCKEHGIGQGRRTGKKSRRTDVDDLTPNPRKLLHIGEELSKLTQVITELPPISELPLNARPRSRKEKNKLASRACRLKKKAQHEANKIKLWGLNNEHDHLLQVIVAIKQQIIRRVQSGGEELEHPSSTQRLAQLVDTLGSSVAGQTSEFVAKVLASVGAGKPPERAGWPLGSGT